MLLCCITFSATRVVVYVKMNLGGEVNPNPSYVFISARTGLIYERG